MGETSGTGGVSGGIGSGRSGGWGLIDSRGTMPQRASASEAAARTRIEVSDGLPSLLSPVTVSTRAAIVFLVQQHDEHRARAAANRTHSLRSARNASIRFFSASGQ